MVFDTISGILLLNLVLQTLVFVNMVTEDFEKKKILNKRKDMFDMNPPD